MTNQIAQQARHRILQGLHEYILNKNDYSEFEVILSLSKLSLSPQVPELLTLEKKVMKKLSETDNRGSVKIAKFAQGILLKCENLEKQQVTSSSSEETTKRLSNLTIGGDQKECIDSLEKQFSTMSLNQQEGHPSYVATIPVVIDSDSDTDSSDGENEDGTFKDEQFNDPTSYFRLYPKKTKSARRGEVLQGIFNAKTNESKKFLKSNATAQISKKLASEGFGLDAKQSKEIARKRLRVVLGFNKMRSLSKSRNGSLQKTVQNNARSSIGTTAFGFFWDGVWQSKDKKTRRWKNCDYGHVRKFYRQLKRLNGQVAQEFRKTIEKTRGHMVPYREIREVIKGSNQTKEAVHTLRKSNEGNPVYNAILDGDGFKFNPYGLGFLSFYDFIISEHAEKFKRNPDVVSGGYRIPEGEKPMDAFAVEMDLLIRDVTANWIRNGVYYPEPNTLVLILQHLDCLEASFIRTNEKNYKSPKETPILIQDLITKRKINPQNSLCFDRRAAIVTGKPHRMKRKFSAAVNRHGRIIRWALEDFRTIRGMSQSHAGSRNWALNLIDGLPLKDVVCVEEVTITHKGRQKELLISAISRLYSIYDRIEMAKKLGRGTNFQRSLIRVLDPKKKLEYTLPKSDKAISSKNGEIRKVWGSLIRITDSKKLKSFIDCFVKTDSGIDANMIQKAAWYSHLEAATLLRKRLCLNFIELALASLSSLFKDEPIALTDVKGAIHRAVLGNTVLEKRSATIRLAKKLGKDARKDIFETTPLHLAAITGNKGVIIWLRSKKSSWLSQQCYAHNKILPLHCAMKFCLDNGVDTELLDLLIGDTIDVDDLGLALYLAVQGDHEPFEMVDFLCNEDAHESDKYIERVVEKIIKGRRIKTLDLLLGYKSGLDTLSMDDIDLDDVGHCLYLAVSELEDPMPVAELLCEYNACDDDSYIDQTLEYVVEKNMTGVFKLLWKHNAPVGSDNLLEVALNAGNTEIADLIEDEGGDIVNLIYDLAPSTNDKFIEYAKNIGKLDEAIEYVKDYYGPNSYGMIDFMNNLGFNSDPDEELEEEPDSFDEEEQRGGKQGESDSYL